MAAFGSSELYSALNQSAITTLLDTYLTKAAIFDDVLVPQAFTGNESINFYLSSVDSQTEIEIYNYTINCRAETLDVSRNIASTVISTINRIAASGYFIYCETLPTISPLDDMDNYNTPITARIKLR